MNKKIIALIVAIIIFIIIAGIVFAVYLQNNSKNNDNNVSQVGNSNNSNVQSKNGMVLINGGTFLMGSPEDEMQRETDEIQHEVTLNDFYISATEVSQKEYEEIMEDNPSEFKGDNLPVENVSWYDAIEYCNKLSEKEGLTPVYTIEGENVTWDKGANGYRLPTEAEWEYSKCIN